MDFEPPDRSSTTPETREVPGEVHIPLSVPRAVTNEPAGTPTLSPTAAQAYGAYLLRNYQAAVDLLEPALRVAPVLAGGQRILGLALAQLNREEEAVERLIEAARQAKDDWLARAALGSLVLRGTETPEAHAPVVLFQEALELAPAAARPAARELLGAAWWKAGQDALARSVPREAARAFAAAAASFRQSAQESGAARLALPPRLAAALVGEAVAQLLVGELGAAQRLFSRAPLLDAAVGGPLARFAAALYELCEELVSIPATERVEVVAELSAVVLRTRLQVGLFDGRRSVELAWMGEL